MHFPQIDPVFFRVGPLALRWYGLMYIIAFIAAYFLVSRDAERRKLPLTRDDVADLIFTLALGVILGGRLGYILIYGLTEYLRNPLEIFAVWHGGMSFHGGATGAVAAGFIFCRKRNIGFMTLADVCVTAAPVGLFFGRIGNFINAELYGRPTDVPWGVVFPGESFPRHPSQLYEALLEGVALFFILRCVFRRNVPPGTVFWAFVSGYGLFRFIVEFFREPDAQMGFLAGWVTMGQLLSFPMFAGGLLMIVLLLRKRS